MELREPREIDFHSERNYMDIPPDIHCWEGNQIYVGIKHNVCSQISCDCCPSDDGLFFKFHKRVYSWLNSQYFHTWEQSLTGVAGFRKHNLLLVCITQARKLMLRVISLINKENSRYWLTQHIHRSTHTYNPLAMFDCAPRLYPLPLLTPDASYLCQPMPPLLTHRCLSC